jgi:ComF family protein
MEVHPLLAPVVDLVFPPRCPLCGAGLAAQTGLCAECWSGLAVPGDPSCAACQRPLEAGADTGTLCVPCLANRPRHDGIAAGTLYNDTSRRLVLALKHGHRMALAPLLARMIAAQLPGEVGPGWLLIPVPLHRWRLWSRGFNQSALLAHELAKKTGASVLVDGLTRTKRTPTLGGLGRNARARALSGAIGVNPARLNQLAGAKVLLVDDVLTSGATSDACVRALKRGGAEKVVIACFARVLDEALHLA